MNRVMQEVYYLEYLMSHPKFEEFEKEDKDKLQKFLPGKH